MSLIVSILGLIGAGLVGYSYGRDRGRREGYMAATKRCEQMVNEMEERGELIATQPGRYR